MFMRKVNLEKVTIGSSTPSPSWESKLDDTHWEDDGAGLLMVWDGPNDWWEASGGSSEGRLSIITYGAGWQSGYRPTHVRVTYQNSVTFALGIEDGYADAILDKQVAGANYVSGTELPLNFGPGGLDAIEDIYRIIFGGLGDYPDGTLEVTNIEFLGP